jgi:methyl-accepting chemotaxis protein
MKMALSVASVWQAGQRMLQKLGTLEPGYLVAGSVLLTIGLVRLLPANALQAADALLGRSGDTLLLLIALAMLMFLLLPLLLPLLTRPGRASSSAPPDAAQGSTAAPLTALLETHLQLDQAIDKKLQEVIVDTENSALEIIKQVRLLYDTANTLVLYLSSTSTQANSLGSDIVASVNYLMEIGAFIEALPAKMTRDLHNVQSVVKEITELSWLVGSVQAISMQSHLLAINASIEGSRAGPAGAAFRVVADEMRLLAANSSEVARKINAGLLRARQVVEEGMSVSIAESSQGLTDVSHAVASIHKLEENFEDMSQYFKTRFAVVTKHNEDLARDIAEVLGHIQYQDVVSQCIERMRLAISQRNAFLQTVLAQPGLSEAELAQLPGLLAQILEAYLQEEDKHRHSARNEEAAQESGSELKFELF